MGGFYLLALKGNQHNFYKDVKDFMDSLRKNEFKDESVEFSTHQTIDKGHGRIETRKIWATTCIAWLEQKIEWKNLKTLIVVETTIVEKEKTSIDCRYFISNLSLDAEALLMIIRNHWAIESKCHWVLNTTFSERKSNLRKGFAPENMSVLRKICLKLIAMIISKLSFKNKRAKAAVDFEYLLKLLLGEDIDTRSNFEKIFDFGNKLLFELFSFATTVF